MVSRAERTEDLAKNLKIFVSEAHIFTSDAIVLADFCAPRHKDKCCDLGTGNGTSVLQLRDAFVKASGIDIPYVIDPRRPGDLDEVYANADKALNLLGWKAERGIEEMCEDTWRWQKGNPNGYRE